MIGTLISGRLTDEMVRRGLLEARVWSRAVVSRRGSAPRPRHRLQRPHVRLWFDVGGVARLSAANPPHDVARLDIVPAGLWGRADSTRTVMRSLAQAIAPLVFGWLADLIAGIAPEQAPIGTHPVVSPGAVRGLRITFLMLPGTLAAAGVFLLRARSTYPRDVAMAAASMH